MLIKCMCDIFKECRKAFNEKRNKNGSEMLRQFSRIYALTTVKEFVFNKVVCSFTEKKLLNRFFQGLC